MGNSEHDSITRLPKLNGHGDYIQWCRRLHAFLRREDPPLVGLQEETTDASVSQHNTWIKMSVKAKCNIVLSLGDNALAQTRITVDDDDKSAKDL